MCYFGWIFLALVGLAAIPEGLAGSWEDKDVHEVPCFDYPPAPANEMELIKTHGEGWWYYLQGNRAHARISALVLTGKVPATEPLTNACGKISRHATGFKQHGFGGMAEFKCEGEATGKRECKADPDSKNTTKEWACQRGTTEATIVWTHANKYAIGLRCSGKGDKKTTVWSLRSTEAKDPPEDVKALVKEVIKKHGFKAENLVDYPQAGCAPAGRSIVPTAVESEDKQGSGYAEDKKSAQGGRSIAAPPPIISWDEAAVKELPCSDFVSAPESDLAVIKTHGEGWWYYVMGNRAHARISSIVLTGKQPGSYAMMTNACTRISRNAGGFKQTGFGGMAEFKCEGEITGKRVCRPDPDSKNTTAEWACQRGPTESVIVWTHANKYAIGIRCSGQGDRTTAVWSLRSTEAKDPPEDVKTLVKEVIKKHGFKEENIVEYPQAACAPAGRSIVPTAAGESEDKQGSGYAEDKKGAQGGRSIAAPAPISWAEADVKELPCSDFASASESDLAVIKTHGDGWWYYVLGNRAHARISSIVLTGKQPESNSMANACTKISRNAGGFKQTGFGGMAEFKCEGEVTGKRVCRPDPDNKNTTQEWACQRGPTESVIVWTHANKYAIGIRCSGQGDKTTAVWSLRSTEPKDPPEDIKALVKEVIKKHGFKEENMIEYPQAGCAPAGRSIVAAAGDEDKQGAGYGADDKNSGSAQGGRGMTTGASPWAEAAVKEVPCSDFGPGSDSGLALLKSHGEGWWYYLQGNRAHARIFSIILTGNPPASDSFASACHRLSRHAGGFKQTGLGGTVEFKCEGELHGGKRVCGPDPESKNMTKEAIHRGPTEASIVWTHANKYAIGLRCAGLAEGATAVWHLRSTEAKDPPEDVKALVKEFIKKHGFKEENIIDYPQAGCAPAPAGRSIAASAGDAEDKQGGGYAAAGSDTKQGGRSIVPMIGENKEGEETPVPVGRSVTAAKDDDKQGSGYAAAAETKQGGRSIGGTVAKADDVDKQGSGYAA